MKPLCDLDNLVAIEFGVVCHGEEGRASSTSAVPADARVQDALREMLQATIAVFDDSGDGEGKPTRYEPGEQYPATRYVTMPLADDLATEVRELHAMPNLEPGPGALEHPPAIRLYFARFTDKQDNRLTAFRRAAQFKGVLKSKNRLVRWIDDSLQIVPDSIFRLDTDFDFVVDADTIHILRPNAFEVAAKLQEAVLDAVASNIKAIQKSLKYVDFESIEEYASNHLRAARCLASILSQGEMTKIDRAALSDLCKLTGVALSDDGARLTVVSGNELAFLEVLDRRRYRLELVKGMPEQYRATSRTKVV